MTGVSGIRHAIEGLISLVGYLKERKINKKMKIFI